MKYRPLGKTGISVSEIGFGAWGIGGDVADGPNSYGPTDDTESRRALRRAFELGVTFFDTSNIYGYGHSEELIGEAFKHDRSKIVIASKAGFTKHRGENNLSPAFLRECLEGSLRRLQTDYIDVYQLHSPPLDLLERTPEAIDELLKMKAEGKIRAMAFSTKNPADGILAIEKYHLESIQVNFNVIDQRAAECGLFDIAKKYEAGIVIRTPLAFGFLSGKIHDFHFNPGDHRSTWPEGQLKRWAEAPDIFSFITQGRAITPAQFALKFCLSFNAVSTVIPGMLHPKEVEENTAASDLTPLSKEDLEAIALVYQSHNFFDKSLKKT